MTVSIGLRLPWHWQEVPGRRHGAVGPTVPALRAALRCSRFAGSRRTRFAQTAASPDPRNAALLGGTEGPPTPHRPPGTCRGFGGGCLGVG
ncbi:hypothetical protein GFK26_32520 [Variovorax paradoxus]|uniref:Uncharacterized protein n=1 Tax=Variovorax paradoxus TaxID=34073 RepID=A0A5Q0MDN5_VARPD|nr:hypothetical protein GFK26_32520 [Variovorax paradoxus]